MKPQSPNSQKQIVVAVSGGFDPVHVGHVRLFRDAKALGDKLVVILNNDNWLLKKKGYAFMNEKERKEVISAIKYVNEVIITKHPKNPEDMSVFHILKKLKPNIFANGGDRDKKDASKATSSLNTDQLLCQRLGIKMVFNVGEGGKMQSSSGLVDKAARVAPRKVEVRIKRRKK